MFRGNTLKYMFCRRKSSILSLRSEKHLNNIYLSNGTKKRLSNRSSYIYHAKQFTIPLRTVTVRLYLLSL